MCLAESMGTRAHADSLLPMQQIWLDWAAAQIEAALALDRDAMELLVSSVRAIIAALDPAPNSVAPHTASMIAAIQSHDRLSQQLSHVVAALQTLGTLAASVPAPTASDWAALRQRQLRSFSMREERELFRRMVPAGMVGDCADEADNGSSQAIEIF